MCVYEILQPILLLALPLLFVMFCPCCAFGIVEKKYPPSSTATTYYRSSVSCCLPPPPSPFPSPVYGLSDVLSYFVVSIASSLTEEEMYHVGCPYYRSMSVPEYAELVHEVTRPTVGLADGGDGEVPRLLTEASFLRQETTR